MVCLFLHEKKYSWCKNQWANSADRAHVVLPHHSLEKRRAESLEEAVPKSHLTLL